MIGPRSLHLRLLVVFALILLPAGAVLLTTSVRSARSYYQEITQRQNAELAGNLLHEGDPLAGVTPDVLSDMVKMLEMANPGVEIYVLDATGAIMQGPPEATLQRTTVALAPIDRFLAAQDGNDERFPILGTDPRRDGSVPFSAARFADGSGFLYVVLTDEPSATLARSVQNSTSLRLVLWGGGIGMVVVLLAGAFAFAFLTRRLRRLTAAVRAYDPSAPSAPIVLRASPPRDEIDELDIGFTLLRGRVHEQFEALEAVDEHRRELITNVSHDLRTPLTALQGALESMEEARFARREGEMGGLIDTARRNATRLGRLIDALFELSYLDGPNTPLHREAFPIAELVDDVVQKFALQASTAGVELVAESTGGQIVVRADIGQIERALSNLLDNALRWTPAGGRVTVRSRREEGRALLEVADTGVGIAPDEQARVFDRFYRVERARGGVGTGLGLAITERIVELHGGEIRLTSVVGEGTTVWIALPLPHPAAPRTKVGVGRR